MSTIYNNYSISAGKGKLYLKSKTPQEGYEEILYGTGEVKDKTYHRYADSIKGLPSFFEIKEISYDGRTLKFMELTLLDGEISNKVSVSLKNTKGGYTDESRALLSALNGLELGEEVTLTSKDTNTTGKNGKEYKNLNIYINYVNRLGENGKGLGTGFIPHTEIPAPIEKIVAGDKTWDWSPQTEFFYTKLGEIQAKFQGASTATPSAPKPLPTASPAQAFPELKESVNTDMQELPF